MTYETWLSQSDCAWVNVFSDGSDCACFTHVLHYIKTIIWSYGCQQGSKLYFHWIGSFTYEKAKIFYWLSIWRWYLFSSQVKSTCMKWLWAKITYQGSRSIGGTRSSRHPDLRYLFVSEGNYYPAEIFSTPSEILMFPQLFPCVCLHLQCIFMHYQCDGLVLQPLSVSWKIKIDVDYSMAKWVLKGLYPAVIITRQWEEMQTAWEECTVAEILIELLPSEQEQRHENTSH